MDDFHTAAAGFKCRIWAAAVALGCVAASGCASALTQPWAKHSSDKALAAAAADDSFPSAAEVGLAESN
ncbi:MAG: hypothetical protein HY288_14320 [Planctomycetia bacterium]|nr:hypothetical protein [Planctomycetia bacterium]